MAHFAELDDNNIVKQVLVVSNFSLDETNQEASGIDFLNNLFGHSNWKQTSYNKKFRKHFAGIGYEYDETKNAFIPPKPYPSWILNEETYLWDPPIPYPEVMTNSTVWDENTQSWIEP
jgi:hypothetical protein